MGFSKKKFNIFLCLTLVLISVVVACSTIDFSTSNSDVSIDQADAETNNGGSGAEDDFSGGDSTSGSTTNQSGLQKVNQTFSSGAQALSYALGLLNKYDYKIVKKQSVDAKAGSIGGVQKVDEWIYNVGGKSYIKTVADGSDVPAGQGENYTEFKKIDGSNITIKKNSKLSSQTTAQYLSTFGVMPNVLPYDMTAAVKTVPLLKDDPAKSYYVLTISLNASCWKDYVKYLTASNNGSGPSMKSITLTVKIDKTYGCINSITANENYEISRGSFTADAVGTISYVFDYAGNYGSAISTIENQLK